MARNRNGPAADGDRRQRLAQLLLIAPVFSILIGTAICVLFPDTVVRLVAPILSGVPLQPRLPILNWTGRARGCTPAQVLAATKSSGRLRDRSRYLKTSMRLLRKDGPFELWHTAQGDWWLYRQSPESLRVQLAEQYTGIYDERGCTGGDVVLDCGANVGIYARHALERGARLVVAVEPDAGNLECLRRNLSSEIDGRRVIVVEKGAWHTSGVLRFFLNQDSAADSFVRRDSEATEIQMPVDTIDNIVRELSLSRVDFIKMDIEGSERHALAGAVDTIRRFHPRMAICAYHLPDDPAAIRRVVQVADSGYREECLCEDRILSIIPQVLTFYRPDDSQYYPPSADSR